MRTLTITLALFVAALSFTPTHAHAICTTGKTNFLNGLPWIYPWSSSPGQHIYTGHVTSESAYAVTIVYTTPGNCGSPNVGCSSWTAVCTQNGSQNYVHCEIRHSSNGAGYAGMEAPCSTTELPHWTWCSQAWPLCIPWP